MTNEGHSTNRREGKQKLSHNRKAGHARQMRQMGTRRGRRRNNRILGQWAETWVPGNNAGKRGNNAR